MNWIGLTGGIGSGKSAVSERLKAKGWPLIDADKVARDVLVTDPSLLPRLKEAFGAGIFLEDGSLDRQALGRVVFGQKSKLDLLESILHPAIQKSVLDQRKTLESRGYPLAIYDVPLLFEKNLQDQFTKVIVVSAPLDLRRQWLRLRDQADDEVIQSRIKAQLPLEQKVQLADYTVDNSGSLQDLDREVEQLHAYLQAQT